MRPPTIRSDFQKISIRLPTEIEESLRCRWTIWTTLLPLVKRLSVLKLVHSKFSNSVEWRWTKLKSDVIYRLKFAKLTHVQRHSSFPMNSLSQSHDVEWKFIEFLYMLLFKGDIVTDCDLEKKLHSETVDYHCRSPPKFVMFVVPWISRHGIFAEDQTVLGEVSVNRQGTHQFLL